MSAGDRGSLEEAIDDALAAAEWIEDADEAAVAVLRSLAAAVDAKRSTTLLGDDSGTPAYDAQVMLRYLGALLMTPEARLDLGTDDDEGLDVVAQLRAAVQAG